MAAILKRILTYHWLPTLMLSGLFALGFGLSSLNIFMVLNANFTLIATHGAMALVDGALLQLGALVVYGYLSVVFYLLFKACERALVDRIFS